MKEKIVTTQAELDAIPLNFDGRIIVRNAKTDFSGLVKLMKEKEVTITTVSKATGISRTTLTAMYYNSGKNYSTKTLASLCEYLSCDIGDIITIRK